MHCPNCGTEAVGEQKFCRSCGLSLEKVSRLLAEQLPVLRPGAQDLQRKIKLWGAGLMGGAAAIALAAVYWAFITQVIAQGNVLAGSLFLIVLTGIILGGLLLGYWEFLQKKGAERRPQQPTKLSERESASRLSPTPYSEPLPGITAHTTELLEGGKTKDTRRGLS